MRQFFGLCQQCSPRCIVGCGAILFGRFNAAIILPVILLPRNIAASRSPPERQWRAKKVCLAPATDREFIADSRLIPSRALIFAEHRGLFWAMGMRGHEETDYKCGLGPEAETAARVELREDESTREQALEQFRDWILKHPTIKRCRTDPVFLLRFLRTKKFSVPMAQDMLERYLTVRQLYPDWFQNLDINDPDIEAIIDSGYLVPLPQKDDHGRQVILSCAGRFDPYKYTSAQMAKVHSLVVEALMDDEENQVHGYTHVNDESGLTMGHLSTWSLTDIRNIMRCIQNSTPIRHKKTHMINIPGCAIKIIEFAISLLSDKLKSRIIVHKNLEDLSKAINPKILPKEYGGEVPLADMIASFKKTLQTKRDQLKVLDDMYIEISPKDSCAASTEGLCGISGSFRKLEVD